MPTTPLPTSMGDPAATLIHERIAEQVEEIHRGERRVRAEKEDAIHDTRVALRRLRTALITYRPFLERSVTDPIGVELKWLGGKLSAARDAEVQTERLRHLNNDITAELHQRWQAAQLQAVFALKAERSAGLLTRLAELAAAPPLTPAAASPINEVLPQQVDKAWKRMGPLVTTARSSRVDGVRAELLHDVRKAAKRARYAAEPLAALGDEAAQRTVEAAKQIQTILGEHQDAITAYDVLEELTTSVPGEVNTKELWAAQKAELARVTVLEREFFGLWTYGAEFTGRSSAEPADGLA